MSRIRPALVLTLSLLATGTARADNWPNWRGPDMNGVSGESNLPTHWDRETKVKWRSPLPEPGNSTPIVWGDRVFVTQPLEGGKQRALLCFDRPSGQQLWQASVDAVEMERTHKTNPYCSPSPVTDGQRVICWFGSVGLVAFDFEGQKLWTRSLGKVDHIFGYGQSPILAGNLCLLNFGPGGNEFAVAVDKVSGEIVWRRQAPQPQAGVAADDIHGTWATPILVDQAAVFCFRDTILGLNPQTGEEIWSCRGLGPQMKASPVAGEGVIVALGGRSSSELAVKTGGQGDVSDSHLLWRVAEAKSRLGSGVIHDGYLFATRSNGIIECLQLHSGESVWEKRLKGGGSNSSFWSSLTLADGKIYAINQEADVFVLDASPSYRLLATNSLGEHTNSSLVIAQGNHFIRTHDALWCIGD